MIRQNKNRRILRYYIVYHLLTIYDHLIPPRKYPTPDTKKNRSIAEHKHKRHDKKDNCKQQQKRLRTRQTADKRIASASGKHKEKRYLIEV